MKINDFDNSFDVQILRVEGTPREKEHIGSASMLLTQLPSLLGVKELTGAYKVVLPPGKVGELMTLKNGALQGLNNTTLVGESGKIVGSAGLQSLSALASPMIVFSVLSMVTGQYFMSQINNSIKELSESIEEVQVQIDTSSESKVFAGSILLKEIKNDWNLILGSESLKSAMVNSIIQSISELTATCYYFENRLNYKISELNKVYSTTRKCAEESLINDIRRSMDFLKYSIELRSCFKTILVFLTTGITKDNSSEISKVLIDDADLLLSSTVQQMHQQIKSVIDHVKKAPTIKQQEQASEISKLLKDVRRITRKDYSDSILLNLSETIKRFELLDSKGETFYIEDGYIYVAQ